MADWLGEELEPPDEAAGVAGLVREWLRAFGPGTAADIKWWLGQTVAAVSAALADVEAVEVDLGGETATSSRATRSPSRRPSPGPPYCRASTRSRWAGRSGDWYLGAHKAQIFDANGNAGPTVWWDGRIVGGWRQDEAGEVEVQLLEDVGADARAAIERRPSG